MKHDLSFFDKTNLKWLKDNTIFLTVVGSQSYGLATETSDIDYKGTAIPPKNYFTGFLDNFEQAEFKTPNPDCCIFNLVKWMALACDNNPSVIEVLWTDPKFYVITSKYWDKIVEHRDKFLSTNVRWRFSGYAIQQLKKLKRHYRWLKDPPVAPPNRKEFDLPEHFVLPKNQLEAAFALIEKKIDSWNPDLSMVSDSERINIMNKITDVMVDIVGASLYLDKDKLWQAAAASIGMKSNFIELIIKEREYKAKKAEWDSYCKWRLTRNIKRAEIEAKVGYDGKDAAALVRLMRMAKEILSTGKVIVERPDREDLLAIKNGLWTYEQVIEFAEKWDKDLDDYYKSSKLPKEPDRKFINYLCSEIVEEFLDRQDI